MTTYVVAPTQDRGKLWVEWQGMGPQIGRGVRVATSPSDLHGIHVDSTIIALDRPELAPNLEQALSSLAQNSRIVLNVRSDPLRQAPPHLLAQALVEKVGAKKLTVREAARNYDFEVSIRKVGEVVIPEFEDPQDALDWLDRLEEEKAARRAERKAADWPSRTGS